MVPLLRQCAIISFGLCLLIVAGCEKPETSSESPATPAAPTRTPSPKSATPNSFDEVTAHLDPGGDFYLYLSTAQWLGKLSESVDSLRQLALSDCATQTPQELDQEEKSFATLQDVVRKSGLEEITGIGASSFAVTPGLHRNKLFAHHYPGKDSGLIWSLYGRQAHPLAGLDLLPIDTAAAAFGDFDLALLISFLRQEASQSGIPQATQAATQFPTQFAGITGLQLDDVLQSLNGSMGLALTLDATNTISVPTGAQTKNIPAPRLAIIIAVKNDLIFKQVDKMMGANPGIIKVDEPDLRMRTMPVPLIPALRLRPTVAQWSGYLIISSDDKLIRDMIAVHNGSSGYTTTPEYATLSAGLPNQGNCFYIQSQRLVDTIHQLQDQTLVNTHSTAALPQAAFFQHVISGQSKKTGHAMAVGGLLPDGWLTVSQGSQGASQLLAPFVIIPAAVAGSVSTPFWMGLSGIHSRPIPPPPMSHP